MRNKYTPISNTEDSNNFTNVTSHSYELDNLGHLSSDAVTSMDATQPLTVDFYLRINKVIQLKLNYYPSLGVKGIHDAVRIKLNSISIALEDEKYQIAVLKKENFRLVNLDVDSVGDKIHYFKSRDQAGIETALKLETAVKIRKGAVILIAIVGFIAYAGLFVFTLLSQSRNE